MEAIWVALIVALASPVLLALINGWVQSRARRADWGRQDEVADRLLAANERSAELAETANEQLTEIHTLVNSNLTAAMRGEWAATEAMAHMMREAAADRASRGETRPEDAGLIEAAEARAAELRAQVNDRAG